MKKQILALCLVLCSTSVLAKDLTCESNGTTASFTLNDTVLLDNNERIVANKVAPNKFEAFDQFGKVSYTVTQNKIVMKFDNVTKVYFCK